MQDELNSLQDKIKGLEDKLSLGTKLVDARDVQSVQSQYQTKLSGKQSEGQFTFQNTDNKDSLEVEEQDLQVLKRKTSPLRIMD